MSDDRILDDGASLGIHHADTLSPGAAAAVAKAARWGKYYLYVILASLVVQFGAQFVAFANAGALVGLISAIVFSLLLYAYPLVKFWGFAHDTPGALAAASQPAFTAAVDQLRSVYKYIGIFLIVIIGIYALLFIGILLFGGLGALAG